MMTAVLTLAVIALSAVIYMMNARIDALHEAISSEVNFLEKLGDWKISMDGKMNAVEQISRNASKKATETARKVERSVIYDSEH